MKKLIILSVASLAVWSLMSCGNGTNNQQSETPVDSAKEINEAIKPVDEESSKFAVEATNGSMMEVAMGKLAQEKGTNERVKAFGTMMVNDHSKAEQEIKDLSAKKSITLPADLSDDTKKHMDDLSKKSGKDFDKSYIDMMVDDHEEDVKAFEKASNDVSDEEIKTWARNTLPTLQAHLDSAKAIKEALKKK
jgi:putative membrane protein